MKKLSTRAIGKRYCSIKSRLERERKKKNNQKSRPQSIYHCINNKSLADGWGNVWNIGLTQFSIRDHSQFRCSLALPYFFHFFLSSTFRPSKNRNYARRESSRLVILLMSNEKICFTPETKSPQLPDTCIYKKKKKKSNTRKPERDRENTGDIVGSPLCRYDWSPGASPRILAGRQNCPAAEQTALQRLRVYMGKKTKRQKTTKQKTKLKKKKIRSHD